ncbi:MAG: hypothetical protein IPO67_03920 [Deltaproteobacteria bacterium]|nr:hypothetical protein [Deltaproteobacteria bacterium]MBK9369072.1 hypothetical protein [Deltaproteobacteria bacterium]MBK9644289.1 hypothetical protein [Deltaproteobacteria bacterium]
MLILPLLTLSFGAAEAAPPREPEARAEYNQGFAAGQDAARAEDPKPVAARSFGIGFGLMAVSVGCAGVVGAPMLLGTCLGPTVIATTRPAVPPPIGPWAEASPPYALGYTEGYDKTRRARRQVVGTSAAMLGAGVGTAVAVGGLVIVGFATDNLFIPL